MYIYPEDSKRMIVMEHVVIACGLCHDQDAENPLDSYGEGKIHHSGNRRGDATQCDAFFRALGCDSYCAL